VPLVLEYEAVLRREEHRKVHGLSVPELDEVINSLVRVAEAVQIRFLWRPLLSDPNTYGIETAVNGRADLLSPSTKGYRGCSRAFCAQDTAPVRGSASITALAKE